MGNQPLITRRELLKTAIVGVVGSILHNFLPFKPDVKNPFKGCDKGSTSSSSRSISSSTSSIPSTSKIVLKD